MTYTLPQQVAKASPTLSTLQLGLGASRTANSGTDRYFLDLLRALPHTGVASRGLLVGEPEALDHPVPNVSSYAAFGVSRRTRWMNQRRAVRAAVGAADLVVSHGSFAAFPVLDIIRNRPLVSHFHGPWALESRAEGRKRIVYEVRRVQEALTYRQSKRFIVLSRAFGEILSREYGVDEAKIRVIPGGVTIEAFAGLPSRAEARERLGWPRDRPIVATVRRLVPSKGIDRLIDAMAIVRRTVPDAFCAIAGGGPLAETLRRRIEERELGGCVRLLGYVPDELLPLVYRAADLFVVPTIAFEGFGLVVLESLACGTPALVTPVGGLPEVVRALSEGLVLSGSSVRDIAEGVSRALAGRHTVPGDEACRAYARRFDWKLIAASVAAVYREAV